jgi:hypothetical protein
MSNLYQDFATKTFGFDKCNTFSKFVENVLKSEDNDYVYLIETIGDLIIFSKTNKSYKVDNDVIEFLLNIDNDDSDVQAITKIALERAYAYTNQWKKAAVFTNMNLEESCIQPPSESELEELENRCKKLGIVKESEQYFKNYVYMFTECDDIKKMSRDEESLLSIRNLIYFH